MEEFTRHITVSDRIAEFIETQPAEQWLKTGSQEFGRLRNDFKVTESLYMWIQLLSRKIR